MYTCMYTRAAFCHELREGGSTPYAYRFLQQAVTKLSHNETMALFSRLVCPYLFFLCTRTPMPIISRR